MRQNEELDRNKASREYPDAVVEAIVTDIVSLSGQGNEKYDQSFSKPNVPSWVNAFAVGRRSPPLNPTCSIPQCGGECACSHAKASAECDPPEHVFAGVTGDLHNPSSKGVPAQGGCSGRNEKQGSRVDYLEKGKTRAKAKKIPKVKVVLPDEISGDCGDDFSPLDVTTAGESSYRAYFVAKKTWQIASACE